MVNEAYPEESTTTTIQWRRKCSCGKIIELMDQGDDGVECWNCYEVRMLKDKQPEVEYLRNAVIIDVRPTTFDEVRVLIKLSSGGLSSADIETSSITQEEWDEHRGYL